MHWWSKKLNNHFWSEWIVINISTGTQQTLRNLAIRWASLLLNFINDTYPTVRYSTYLEENDSDTSSRADFWEMLATHFSCSRNLLRDFKYVPWGVSGEAIGRCWGPPQSRPNASPKELWGYFGAVLAIQVVRHHKHEQRGRKFWKILLQPRCNLPPTPRASIQYLFSCVVQRISVIKLLRGEDAVCFHNILPPCWWRHASRTLSGAVLGRFWGVFKLGKSWGCFGEVPTASPEPTQDAHLKIFARDSANDKKMLPIFSKKWGEEESSHFLPDKICTVQYDRHHLYN